MLIKCSRWNYNRPKLKKKKNKLWNKYIDYALSIHLQYGMIGVEVGHGGLVGVTEMVGIG